MKERSSGYHVKANVYRSDSRYTRSLLIDSARTSPILCSFPLAVLGLVRGLLSSLLVRSVGPKISISTVTRVERKRFTTQQRFCFVGKPAAAINGEMDN